MSESYDITAETRVQNGKGSSRRMRRLENKIPAIIYGGDKHPAMVSLDHNYFANLLENEAFYSHILTLNVEGKKEKVVLKDLHRHPSKPKILHADFLRVSPKTKLTMNVPLHFKGGDIAPGVKAEGGIVSHLMSEVEIRCLPADLPEFIEVDLSKLSMGDSIHLSQIKLPKGVELVMLLQGEEFDQPIANIHKPTVIAEEEAPTETTEEETPSEASEEKPEGESEV